MSCWCILEIDPLSVALFANIFLPRKFSSLYRFTGLSWTGPYPCSAQTPRPPPQPCLLYLRHTEEVLVLRSFLSWELDPTCLPGLKLTAPRLHRTDAILSFTAQVSPLQRPSLTPMSKTVPPSHPPLPWPSSWFPSKHSSGFPALLLDSLCTWLISVSPVSVSSERGGGGNHVISFSAVSPARRTESSHSRCTTRSC